MHGWLCQAFDHALAALNRNGRFAELYLRWFPNGLY
jgi:polar amino acid transport system substrate-binding protein